MLALGRAVIQSDGYPYKKNIWTPSRDACVRLLLGSQLPAKGKNLGRGKSLSFWTPSLEMQNALLLFKSSRGKCFVPRSALGWG